MYNYISTNTTTSLFVQDDSIESLLVPFDGFFLLDSVGSSDTALSMLLSGDTVTLSALLE